VCKDCSVSVTALTMLRQKKFGGKSGVWYGGLKRKRGLYSSSKLIDQRQDECLFETNRETSGLVFDQTLESDMQQNIQWDEILCRPIYQRASSWNGEVVDTDSPWKSNSTNLIQTNYVNQATVHGCDPLIVPTPSKESDLNERNVVTFDRECAKFNGKKQSYTRSTFGSKSHGPMNLDAIDEEKFYEYNLSDTKRSLAFTSKDKESSILIDKRDDDIALVTSSDKISTQVETSKLKVKCNKDQHNTVRRGKGKLPNPHSDLTGVCAYFKNLDQNERLSIVTTDEKCIDKNAMRNVDGQMRTRRKLTGGYQSALQNDYNKYSIACKESNIAPVPVNNFVEQRVSFASSIYEGFLDE
jgi:hypothetical protein